MKFLSLCTLFKPNRRLPLIASMAVAILCGGTLTQAIAQPANDNFTNAVTITGLSGSVSGDNFSATTEPGEPVFVAGAPNGASIWYAWTAPASGTATFTTAGSLDIDGVDPMDTILGIYTGNSVDALTSIVENDDGPVDLTSLVTFPAIANQTYYILLGGYGGTEGTTKLTWSISTLAAGDFHWTSSLYIYSDRDSIPPVWSNMKFITNRFTITRSAGSSGRVLVHYTVTNDFYTDTHITNVFGTNFYYTNFDVTSNQLFWTNITMTNMIVTNRIQNMEYGELVTYDQVLVFTNGCTNGTLFSTNPTITSCPLRLAGDQNFASTNYSTNNFTILVKTNVMNTNVVSTQINNLSSVTNGFWFSNIVVSISPSAIPFSLTNLGNWDYVPVSGTAVMDDFQMSSNVMVSLNAFNAIGFNSPSRNAYVIATIDDVELDPLESTDISPPSSSVSFATMNILRSFNIPGGTNALPTVFGIVGFPGQGGIGTNVINFERSTIRCSRTVGTALVEVTRSGFGSGTPSVSWRVDYAPNRVPHENANDLFRQSGADFSNPEIPLQAGSEYATPISPWDFSPAPIDFDSVVGSHTFGATEGSFTIPISISNSPNVNFNKDLLLQLYFPSPVDPNTASLGYVRDCVLTILYDKSPAGAVDTSYNNDFDSGTLPPYNQHPGANGTVYATAVQNDGKTILAGDFTSYNTTNRYRIARANIDGSLDLSFDPGSGANSFISAIAVDSSSGNILTAGAFTSFNGTTRKGIARLNTSGALDGSFNPGSGIDANDSSPVIWALAVQSDGKIIIGGDFNTVGGTNRNFVARLNSDGSVDPTFSPGAGPNGIVHAVALQPDGKIIIGGEFTQISGVSRNRFARLNSDGSLDTSYDVSIGADDVVYAIALQNDGKAIIGGTFHNVANLTRNSIARVNTDGSIDLTFHSGAGADDTIYSITLQPDQEILIGGLFSTYNETRRMSLARLFTDGTLDTSFLDPAYNQYAGLPKHLYNPAVEPHPFIYSISLQADSNVIIGGGFDRVGGGGTRDDIRNRNNFARLLGGATPGPGNVGFAQNSYNADENAGTYFVTMQRNNGGTIGEAGVTLLPILPPPGPGSAVLSNDFFIQPKYVNPTYVGTYPTKIRTWQLSDGTFGQNQGGTETVNPGSTWNYTTNDVFVNIINNTNVDGNRTMTLELHNPTDRDLFTLGGENIGLGPALGLSSASFNIIDDDTLSGIVGFASTNFNVAETIGVATITVIRTNGTANNLQLQYQTSDGTAHAGINYKAKSGQLTFGPGVSTNFITVSIIHDGVATDDQFFNISMFNLTGGAKFGISNCTVTVIDSDSPNGRLRFTSPTYATNENAGAAIVGVRRGGGSQGTLSVTVSTIPDAVPGTNTAVAGVDYFAATNVLTWNPNDVADKYLTIPLINNQIVDGNRSLNVRLYNPILNTVTPTNVVIGSGSNSVVTIVDDDAYGSLNFTRASYSVRESGGPAIITVQRTSGIAQAVTVNFSASGGTAIAGSQYAPTNGILSFGPGEVAKSFTVQINDNLITDGNRTVNLTLFNANPAASLGPVFTSTLTIVDDEIFNQQPGSLDTTTDPSMGFNGDVLALALQTNGMILAGGDFTLANNLIRNRIARLNTDGSLDTTFSSPFLGVNDSVRAIVSQTDTRVVIGGFFTNVNGTLINRIARLNYTGTLDSTFNPGAGADNNVFALAETFGPDGSRKLFVGGAFININSVSRSRIARLNDNGTVDLSFSPSSGANGTVYAVVPYPTNSVRAGQVLIVGDFTTVNGVACGHIARLNADGSVDSTFAPTTGANDSIRAIALQADERVLIGGVFTNVNSTILPHIARLNADGSVDSSFVAGLGANDSVSAIAVQEDNKIVLGGQFTLCSGVTRHRITRLNSDGTVDPDINFGLGADNAVAALVIQPDDKIVLGGSFTNYDGVTAQYIARIYGRSVNGSGDFEFDAPSYSAAENATNLFVTVRRRGGTSGFPAGNVTLTLSTTDGTAHAGTNYTAVNTTLTFPPGEVVQTIAIPLIHDFLITPDLYFTASLSNPQPSGGPSIGNQFLVTNTIINVDSGIAFSDANYSVNEDISTGVATIQINRTGSTAGTSSIDFSTTTNGTAIAGVNYTPVTNTTVTFLPGQSSNVVQVPVIHDPSANGDRTVSLQLSNAVGSLLLPPSQASLNIIDVERAAGQFEFSASAYAAGQSTGYVTITVIRTNGHSGDVSVQFATADSNALAGVDYIATNGPLHFQNGQTVQFFTVPILDKPTVQNPRSFTISLFAPTGGASLGAPSLVPVTIYDYHIGVTLPNPILSVNEDAGSVTIPVSRINGTSGSLSVQYATTNGTATSGVNYTATAGVLNFVDGEALKTITVPILQDHLIKGNQTFSLGIFNVQPPGAAQLLISTSTVTILDTTVGFYFSNAVYNVSKGGTNVTVTVVRTNSALAGTNSVSFATADGSAVAGVDYSQTFGTLIFTNSESSKDIVIPIIQNNLLEGDLDFTVSLSNVGLTNSALLIDPSNATVNIIDNNSAFSFSSPAYSVSEAGLSATIPIVRSGVTSNTASVFFYTADGSATNGNYTPTNGTLVFTNGETVKYFTVPIIDDNIIQGDHTVLLGLSNVVGSATTLVAPSAAVLTIVDNDGSVILPAGVALTSESGPVNGIIDPGETVTMLLGLRNSVGQPTANLVATLLATNGVTPITSSQNYGVLVPKGPSASRAFSFTANGSNGAPIVVTLRLTDGASTNGFPSIATFNVNLGTVTARFTNSATITVNDNTNASPYPSIINVPLTNGVVSKASVTLSNFTHTSAYDVEVMLSAPGGANMLLMGDVGGHTAFSRANFTFDDAYPPLSASGPLVTGTNHPSAVFPIAPLPSPAPQPAFGSSYPTNLAACSNSNPGGAWSLWVADSRMLDTGGITNGWILSLNIASAVQPAANVAVSVSAAPSTVVVQSNMVYSVSVSNYGPATATGIAVTNFLPPSVVLQSASVGGYTLNGNILTFTNLGNLAAGTSLNFNYTVSNTVVGVNSNVVVVAARESDPYLGDNIAAVTNSVVNQSADLAVYLSGPGGPVLLGDNFTYTMVVSNGGPATAQLVKVTNTLPAGVSFVSASSGGAFNSGKVVFNLGMIGAGYTTNCSITVKGTVLGTFTDSAVVADASTNNIIDPFKANNFESVKTDVQSQVVQINIQKSGNFMIISWPVSAGSYVPETTTSLTSPSWTQITVPAPQTNANQISITLGLTNSSRYFRLRGP